MTTSDTGSHDSFAIFFSGLRRRESDAWYELTRRYTKRLIALARKKLDVRLGSKLDPEDVVQSVYRLLHARLAGKGLRAESWEHLWGMLALLTAQRCNNWFRHYLATQKRGLETPLLPEKDQAGDEGPIPAASSEPTPAEAAELADEVHRLLPRLDPQTAKILWLGLLGFTDGEVATELGITDARVRIAREDCSRILNVSLGRTQD